MCIVSPQATGKLEFGPQGGQPIRDEPGLLSFCLWVPLGIVLRFEKLEFGGFAELTIKFVFAALPCVADGHPGFHAVLPVKQGLDLLAVNTGKQQRRHKSAGYLRHRECPPHIMDIARQA